MNGTCIKIEETEIRTVLVGGGNIIHNNNHNNNSSSSSSNICNRNGAKEEPPEAVADGDHVQITPQSIQSSKIILSPRVEFRHVINKNPDLEIIETTGGRSRSLTPPPAILFPLHQHHQQQPQQQQQQVIITAAHDTDNSNSMQQNRSSQVRVIKDGRFYEEPATIRPSYIVNSNNSNHNNNSNSNSSSNHNSMIQNGINRQVNVITSDRDSISVATQNINHNNSNSNMIFRPPVVSSTSQPMRPPPPPPPPKLKGSSPSEEPSSSIPDLEFDGTTVLCRVCGDKASGFHYGVHSCEGCKGFFRRSIQQKIQYRPCTKNQQCCILRINRNRCQYCRLKKCIAVGMSRDAVRFGRVPKREKARILAAMQQSTQNRGQQRQLATELDDQPRLLSAVLRAHMETCEFTRDKVTAMRQRARDCPTYSMPTLACPLNPAPELQSEQEFSQRFAHVIRGVIDFAGMIPGFQFLTQDDKFTLLKAGLFDALFVRLICMFDSEISSIICLNGQVMRRDAIQNGANARFLVDSTFNFAERINSMNLTDAEIGLFCAIVLITPDRPGLRNLDLIEKMYSRLKTCLQSVIMQNRPDQPEFMGELMKTLPDLRTLSTLHTEKLVVFRTEHKELLRQQMWSLDEESSKSPHSAWGCNGDNIIEDVAKSPMGSVSSTESSDTISSDYTHSLTSSAPLLAASLSGGCPLRHRASSGSSAEDDIGHLTQNGLTITPVVRAVPPQHHIRYRKLDSPTDSGIESGNEKPDHKPAPSSGSSSCSSPRSSVEDVTEEKKFHVEDMPVLKRVLQAPPLYDTNSLMDEAYKPHKKFRAMRHRESEAEPESSNSINLNNNNSNSSNMIINNNSNNNNISNTNSTHHHHTTTTTITAHPIHHHVIQQTSSTTNSTTLGSPSHHLQVNSSSSTHNTANSNLSQSCHNSLHPQQSQLHMHLTRPQHQTTTTASSLSSTHSVLAKSLMEEPRMTPEQMKRSDIIQNYIMRESQQENGGYRSPHPTSSSSSSPHPHLPSSNGGNTSSQQQHQGLLVVSGRWQPSSGPASVITTTRNHSPSPNTLNNDGGSRYYQSPHSTSSSSASSSPPQSIKSPRLLELQVDIADTQQPLNLSKKSPTPPRSLHKVMLEA